MNQNSVSSDTNASDKTPFCVGTDLTVLVDLFQSMAQETKKEIAELNRLQRDMYSGIIQKQNNELEEYRRGALQQSLISVLRSVALIYNENYQDFGADSNPADLQEHMEYILSQLRELLLDNDVHISQSAPGDEFDRKLMRTEGKYIIPTANPEQERKVVKSIKPGFVFCGTPVLQELVSIYQYKPELTAEEQTPVMSGGSEPEMNDIPVAELVPMEETGVPEAESAGVWAPSEDITESSDTPAEFEDIAGSSNVPPENDDDKKLESEESNHA